MKGCSHDWRYYLWIDGRERRYCLECEQRQVKGFRNGDRDKWYDSLWAAFHDWSIRDIKTKWRKNIDAQINKAATQIADAAV